MQEGPAPTVLGIARDSNTWPAVSPMAGTTDVSSRRIGQENVCALVSALSSAFESSAGNGESGEVGVIIDGYKDIGVLRVAFVPR
jgi:ribosomal protein S5